VTCKINHADPECIPLALCATCNPRDKAIAEQAEQAQRATLHTRVALDAARRKLHKATGQLNKILAKGEPVPGTIKYRVSQSLPRKIAELQLQIETLTQELKQ
jgi:hypothetical protein